MPTFMIQSTNEVVEEIDGRYKLYYTLSFKNDTLRMDSYPKAMKLK